jgi:hypothetical protein
MRSSGVPQRPKGDGNGHGVEEVNMSDEHFWGIVQGPDGLEEETGDVIDDFRDLDAEEDDLSGAETSEEAEQPEPYAGADEYGSRVDGFQEH